jgi:hypothetical protein
MNKDSECLMMVMSKLIRNKLLTKIPQSTMYNKIKSIKSKTGNSISEDIALDILASQHGIDVYNLLKKEGRMDEIMQFQDAVKSFDFGNNVHIKDTKRQIDQTNLQKEDRSPYDLPLSKFNLDIELTKDCKMHPPYRNVVNEAFRTLETRIKKVLNLPESSIGIDIISQAEKMGIFKKMWSRNNRV